MSLRSTTPVQAGILPGARACGGGVPLAVVGLGYDRTAVPDDGYEPCSTLSPERAQEQRAGALARRAYGEETLRFYKHARTIVFKNVKKT